ncbi:MAG: tetratricopeptide repeat protein, partial [Myxococcales bacterium]|nr:tetratricopeptide repeat protein [Myxococcales bacterium]
MSSNSHMSYGIGMAFFCRSSRLAALILLLLPELAWAQAEVRRLERATEGVGPAELSRDDLAPLFAGTSIADAGLRIDRGETDGLTEEIDAWLSANGDDPRRAYALFLAGMAANGEREYEAALNYLEPAAALLPELDDHAFYYAALAAFELEDYQRVIELALAIPESSTFGPRSQFLRGRALRANGQVSEAIRVLRAFANSYPGAWYIQSVELNLAEALQEQGDLVAAAEMYARVAARYPGSDEEGEARRALDAILDDLPEAARNRLRNISDDDLIARARVLFDRHRNDQLIELLNDELDRFDVDTPLGCEATWMVGRTYTKLRDHAASLPYYEAIINSQCESTDHMVWSLYKAGQALWNL